MNNRGWALSVISLGLFIISAILLGCVLYRLKQTAREESPKSAQASVKAIESPVTKPELIKVPEAPVKTVEQEKPLPAPEKKSVVEEKIKSTVKSVANEKIREKVLNSTIKGLFNF